MRYSVRRRFFYLWAWVVDADRGGARGIALSRGAARWAARTALRERQAEPDPPAAPGPKTPRPD